MCKEGETRTIKSTKVKDGKDIPLTNFRLQEIELPESWRDPDDPDETVTSCVFALDGAAEQKESASMEKKRKLSGPQEIAIRALHDAIVESGQHDPKGTLGAHLAAWRKIAYSRGISGGDTQDAKKKAFERARADLMKRNEVVCLDDIYHFVDVGKQASASLLFNKKNPYSNFNDNNETIGTSGTDRDKSGHVSICLDGLPSDRDRGIGTDRDTTL